MTDTLRKQVPESGLLIPREMLDGAREVDIRREDRRLVLVPVETSDPLLDLGRSPIGDEVVDASTDHDRYLYK